MHQGNPKYDSKRSYSNANSVRITMSLDTYSYGLIKAAANICGRSLKSEVRVRAADCLSRYEGIASEFAYSRHEKGSKYLTIEIDHYLNVLLTRLAKESGRSKETELILRLISHIQEYELFITPNFNIYRLSNS